jgi:hypothetical protein
VRQDDDIQERSCIERTKFDLTGRSPTIAAWGATPLYYCSCLSSPLAFTPARALHCIALHRIASHCIALHRIYRLAVLLSSGWLRMSQRLREAQGVSRRIVVIRINAKYSTGLALALALALAQARMYLTIDDLEAAAVAVTKAVAVAVAVARTRTRARARAPIPPPRHTG